MRLWSIHPKYLDTAGLLALWREALLAQKVLRGETTGYKKHPQLERFRGAENSIGDYLLEIYYEAVRRGYNFNKEKILAFSGNTKLPIPQGQLEYEFNHLMKKLSVRSPHMVINVPEKITPHPVFYITGGGVSKWEVLSN